MSVVKNLYRDFGSFAIEIQDWNILDHGVTALSGPSGAGKSTIVHILLGLETEASLEWHWDGEALQNLTPSQRNLGVVFQEPGLFPHLSVKDNILFPVDCRRHLHWNQDFDRLVEQLRLESLLASRCEQISGGEAQRVALARALIYRPRLLILDEPFSSLDLDLRAQSREMLLEMKLETPILLISHDPEDIQVLADKVTYLEKGKIVEETNR